MSQQLKYKNATFMETLEKAPVMVAKNDPEKTHKLIDKEFGQVLKDIVKYHKASSKDKNESLEEIVKRSDHLVKIRQKIEKYLWYA